MPITTTTEMTNRRVTAPVNSADINLPRPSVALNQQFSNTAPEVISSPPPGHRLANDEDTALINTEQWDEEIDRALEEMEKTNEERTTFFENEPIRNPAQLNQGGIEANIYQSEAPNPDFQALVQQNINPELSEINNQQNVIIALTDQRQNESAPQNLFQEAQNHMDLVIAEIDNVLENSGNIAANAARNSQFWRRINNVVSFLENPTFLGSFTLGVILSLSRVLLRGILENPNSRLLNRIPSSSSRPTSTNSTNLPTNPLPQIQSQPEINPQSGITHLPTSEISDWSQRPN